VRLRTRTPGTARGPPARTCPGTRLCSVPRRARRCRRCRGATRAAGAAVPAPPSGSPLPPEPASPPRRRRRSRRVAITFPPRSNTPAGPGEDMRLRRPGSCVRCVSGGCSNSVSRAAATTTAGAAKQARAAACEPDGGRRYGRHRRHGWHRRQRRSGEPDAGLSKAECLDMSVQEVPAQCLEWRVAKPHRMPPRSAASTAGSLLVCVAVTCGGDLEDLDCITSECHEWSSGAAQAMAMIASPVFVMWRDACTVEKRRRHEQDGATDGGAPRRARNGWRPAAVAAPGPAPRARRLDPRVAAGLGRVRRR